MISAILSPELSTQLFQIFSIIGYCIDHKRTFIFNKTNVYWDIIFRPLLTYTTNKELDYPIYNELLDELPENATINSDLHTTYFFRNKLPIILSLLKWDNLRKRVFKKYTSYFSNISISLCIIDDYDYCETALSTFQENINVLYTYSDPNVLTQLQGRFKCNFICIQDLSDWEQLIIFSLCNHNIISDSLLSWWGAYLNPSKHKIVIYSENCNLKKDILLEEWIQL